MRAGLELLARVLVDVRGAEEGVDAAAVLFCFFCWRKKKEKKRGGGERRTKKKKKKKTSSGGRPRLRCFLFVSLHRFFPLNYREHRSSH